MRQGKLVFLPWVTQSLTPREARALLALSVAGWPSQPHRLRGSTHPARLAGLNKANWSLTFRALREKGLVPPPLARGGLLVPRDCVPRLIEHFRSLRRAHPFVWEVLSALESVLEEGEEG